MAEPLRVRAAYVPVRGRGAGRAAPAGAGVVGAVVAVAPPLRLRAADVPVRAYAAAGRPAPGEELGPGLRVERDDEGVAAGAAAPRAAGAAADDPWAGGPGVGVAAVTSLRRGDEKLHHSDGSHRWSGGPADAAGQAAYQKTLHEHMDAHREALRAPDRNTQKRAPAPDKPGTPAWFTGYPGPSR